VCQLPLRKEVALLDLLDTFVVTVLAEIVSYYICKWLDRF